MTEHMFVRLMRLTILFTFFWQICWFHPASAAELQVTAATSFLASPPVGGTVALVVVTHVTTEPLDQSFECPRARVRIEESILGPQATGMLDIVDSSHRMARPGSLGTIGSFVPARTPRPAVGDSWLLKWRYSPDKRVLRTDDELLLAVNWTQQLDDACKGIGTVIREHPRERAMAVFLERLSDARLVEPDRLRAVVGFKLASAGIQPLRTNAPENGLLREVMLDILIRENPTGLLRQTAIEHLSVETAQSQLSPKDVSCIRYLMQSLSEESDNSLRAWIANALGSMAFRYGGGIDGGRFAYYPEIEAALIAYAKRGEEPHGIGGRSRANVAAAPLAHLRSQRERANASAMDRNRIWTISLP